MTDIDTAAIRADMAAYVGYGPNTMVGRMFAVLDAIDAALGLSRDAHAICCHERIEATDRAEAAEARIATALAALSVNECLNCLRAHQALGGPK